MAISSFFFTYLPKKLPLHFASWEKMDIPELKKSERGQDLVRNVREMGYLLVVWGSHSLHGHQVGCWNGLVLGQIRINETKWWRVRWVEWSTYGLVNPCRDLPPLLFLKFKQIFLVGMVIVDMVLVGLGQYSIQVGRWVTGQEESINPTCSDT